MTTPFIFLTARTSKPDRRQGMWLGADDYIEKPFSLMDLLLVVNTRLKRSELLKTEFQDRMNSFYHQLAATLPHEFRTPLVGVVTGSEVVLSLQDSLSREDILSTVRIIHSSAKRLYRLVENYLLYVQLTNREEDISLCEPNGHRITQPIEQTIAEEAAAVAQRANRADDLALQVAAISSDPPHVLRKIVQELLDNAFKFSSGGSTVIVGAVEDGSTLELTVTDHGRGMTGEQIARVAAFTQFDRERHEQQGVGLGLAIAKLLAERWDGTLTIDSIPGVQTTVHVRLPING